VELPHEEDAWIEIRQLGFAALRSARERQTVAQVRMFREYGGSLANLVGPSEPAASTAERDPILDYDLQALLEAGIVRWSYEEPVTPENISALDEETAQYIARQLLPKPTKREALKLVAGGSTTL
jgi:hypothetical protein